MIGTKRTNFRTLIESQKAGTIVHWGGQLLFANKAFADIVGETDPRQLVSRTPPQEWIAPDDKERLLKRYGRINLGEECAARYEFRVCRRDGTEAWVEAFDHRIEWHRTDAIQTLVLEITARKTFEDNLQLQETQFRVLAEDSAQAFLVHREDKPLFVNKALAEILGFDSRAEALAIPAISELQPPSERERLRGYGEACLNGKEPPPPYETQVMRKDGSVATLECAVAPIDWNGAPAIQISLTEIAERLQARAAVEESRARFRDFADVASDWFWEADETLEFTGFYGDANHEKPISTSNLIGRTLFDARITEDARDDDWIALKADLTDHRPFRDFQFPMRGTDGSINQINVSGKPVFDAEYVCTGYRGIYSDVTELVTTREDAATSKQLLTDAIEAMPDAFVVYDAQDRLVICNSNFRNGMFKGITDLIVPGANFADLMNAALERGLVETSADEKEEYLRDCITHHRNGSGAFEIAGKDNRRVIARERRMAHGGAIGIHTDITKRRRTEDSLRASEQRFRDFAELSGGWYWETDEAFRFSFRSDGVSNLGTKIKKTWFDLKLPEDDDEKWAAHRANLEASRSFSEFQYIQHDEQGKIRHISATGRPIFGVDGQLVGYHGTGRDITAHIETENELATLRQELEQRIEQRTKDQASRIDEMAQKLATLAVSESKYRQLVDRSAQGIVVDVKSKPVFANQLFVEILGFDNVDEFLAKDSIATIRHPDDVKRPGERMEVANQGVGHTPCTEVFRALAKDRSTVWLEACSMSIDWEGNAATLTSYINVTEREQKQDALVESERNLSMHLANTSLAATVWSMDMSCTGWNGAAEKLFGFSSDEIMGRCPIDLIVPEPTRKNMREVIRVAVHQNRARQQMIENVTKDGRRMTCEWFITPLVDDDGAPLGIASLVRDVTDAVQDIGDLRAEVDTVGKANRDLAKCLVDLKKELRTPMEALSKIARSIDAIPEQSRSPGLEAPETDGRSGRPAREVAEEDAKPA